MRALVHWSVAALATASFLAACGSDDNQPDNTGTSGGGSAAALRIDSFSVEDSATCSGDNGTVKAEWTTTGAESVDFSVDGQPVPADAGQPLSGSGDVPVPCDGSSHDVTLTATGSDGNSTSDTKQVSTVSTQVSTSG
jgi:hypothetical protein